MRQAGRYLPEYRALRAEKGGFLELVYDPEAAAEVTLQPIRRFGFDGAILFSDILIVPHALGQDLRFEAGEGPRLSPPLVDAALDRARAPCRRRLEPIYRTVEKVKAALPAETTLLGFAGSPWTVATYMVAGQGSRDQAEARRYAYADPRGLRGDRRRDRGDDVDYLSGQIAAGVEAVQLFDSWAGSLSPAQFERWVIAPTARIVAGAQGAPSRRAGDRLSEGRRRASSPLMRARPGSTRSASTRRSIPIWAARDAARRSAAPGQSRSARAARRRRGA